VRKFQLTIYLIPLFCISCNKKNGINQALNIAGDNKQEIIKVLDHFKENPADSIKFQAAEFLIEQMNYNYSTDGFQSANDSIVQRFNRLNDFAKKAATGDSLIPLNTIKKLVDTLFVNNVIKTTIPPKQFSIDAECIKSDELIAHIDKRFEIWENSKFCKNLSKHEFFETVLPYRVRFEPLDLDFNYYDLFYDFFNQDANVNTTKQANIKINNYLKFFRFAKPLEVDFTYKGFYSILEEWGKECVDKTSYVIKIFRSAGIPCYLEFNPQWANRITNRRHFWCSLRTENGKYELFSPHYEVIGSKSTYESVNDACKIFRYIGTVNENLPFFQRKKNEFIPDIFNSPFISDVTDTHFDVVNIVVPITDNETDNNFCYLATFNAPEWTPVDFAKKDGSNVSFKKVRPGRIYAVINYNNDEKQPKVITKPFFVKDDGKLNYINPGAKTKLILFQKYQQKEDNRKFKENVIGATIECANKRDFSDADTLYTINSYPKPLMHSVNLNHQKKYRYSRIISDEISKSLYITHIEFHTTKPIYNITEKGIMPYVLSNISEDSLSNLKQDTKLKGEVYCSIRDFMSQPMKQERLNGCDGNYNTHTFSSEISFDYGSPQIISSFRFAPIHADNWVVMGQRYALYYYDKGWQLVDTIKAKYNYLEFKNVPSNTIYWLRNIDSGKEEHHFIYKDGKQIFINTREFNNYVKNKPTIFN